MREKKPANKNKMILTCGSLLTHSLDSINKMSVFVVNQSSQITTVIKDHVKWLSVREENGLLDTPNVLIIRFT